MKGIVRVFTSQGYVAYQDLEVEFLLPIYYANGKLCKRKTIQNGYKIIQPLMNYGLDTCKLGNKSQYIKILDYWE